jgi:phosphonate transport system substrate-binding protein
LRRLTQFPHLFSFNPSFNNLELSMIKKLLAGLTGVALVTFNPVQAQDLKEINFGIISTESSQNLKSDWKPILDAMGEKTGMKVNAFFASDYAGIIEGMRFNKVQVAWFGNKSAMEAVDRAQGEVFAQMVNADGSQGYYSHLIVHKDSPLKSLDDMLAQGKNLSFGNGDPNSTSGFLVPEVDPRSQSRIQRHGRGQQTSRCGHQQQREPGENQGQPAREIQGNPRHLDLTADSVGPACHAQRSARGYQGQGA